MESITFKIDQIEFKRFLDIIGELNKVSDTHKLKWENENLFIYSIMGDGAGQHQKIDVLKIFILKRDKLFTNFPEINLTWIIIQTKQWLKQSSFLLDDNEEIDLTFNYDEEANIVYSTQIKNSTLQLNSIGGNDTLKNIPSSFIKEKMNPKHAEWSVEMNQDMIKKIKKLSKLDNNNEIISFTTIDGQACIKEESLWDLKLNPKGDVKNGQWMFKKEHLDRITLDEVDSILAIFPSYIAVKEKESMLLFNLDLTA